jgi:hypothetical protein
VTLYLVVMFAVYDHGTCGIFSTAEAADAHARSLYADSDGHHDFRVEEVVVDEPIFIGGRSMSSRTPRHEPSIPHVVAASHHGGG